MISTVDGCLLWPVAAGVLVEADAVARLEGLLARALEANERLAALVERQREEIARLREELAVRDRELERVNAELAVLKRMLFGRSSERARPGTAGGGWSGGMAAGKPAGMIGFGPLRREEREARAGSTGGPPGLLAPAAGGGGLGLPRRRVLLPGVRHAV